MSKKRTVFQREADRRGLTSSISPDYTDIVGKNSTGPVDTSKKISTEDNGDDIFIQSQNSLFDKTFSESKKEIKNPYEGNAFQDIIDDDAKARELNKAFEEQMKYSPIDLTEEQIQGSLTEQKFKEYKDEKAEYNELKKRTYAGYQKEFLSGMLKDNSMEIKDEDNFFKTTGKALYNSLSGAMDITSSFVGAGILKMKEGFTKEEKERYEALDEKINTIEKPVLIENKAVVQKRYEEALARIQASPEFKKLEAEGVSSDNSEVYNLWNQTKRSYEKALKSYDHAINNTGYFANFFDKPEELATVGYATVPDNMRVSTLQKKVNESGFESLSEIEQEALQSYHLIKEVEQTVQSKNTAGELGQSVRNSAIFMGENVLTTAIGGGAGKLGGAALRTLLPGVAKTAATLGTTAGGRALQGLGQTAGMAGQSFLHGSTYDSYVDSKLSSGEVIKEDGKESIVYTDAKKRSIVSNAKSAISSLKADISALRKKEKTEDLTEEEQAKLQDYTTRLYEQDNIVRQLVDEKGEIRKEEFSNTEAGINAVVGTLGEKFSEKFVGGAADKQLGAISKSLKNSRLLKGAADSRIGRGLEKVNDVLVAGRKTLDKTLDASNFGGLSRQLYNHTGTAKMFHSLPAEMAEEMFVQFIPEFKKDYAEKVNELATSDFYTMVLGSTLIMGGKASALGGVKHFSSMANNPQYRAEYNQFQDNKKSARAKYMMLDAANTDEKLSKQIAMNTLGTLYDYKEYNQEIANLRREANEGPEAERQDKLDKADKMEENSFYNLAIQAISTDTVSDLRHSLKGLKKEVGKNYSGLTSFGSGAAIDTAIKNLNDLEDITKKHADKINYFQISTYSINDSLLNKTKRDIEQKIESKKEAVQSILDRQQENSGTTYVLEDLSPENVMNDPEINNLVANLVHTNNESVDEYFNLKLGLEEIDRSIESNNQLLEYELNENNALEIRKREFIKTKSDKFKSIVDEASYDSVVTELERDLEGTEYLDEALKTAEKTLELAKLKKSVQEIFGLPEQFEQQFTLPGDTMEEVIQEVVETIAPVVVAEEEQPTAEQTAEVASLFELTPDEQSAIGVDSLFSPIERNDKDESQNEKVASMQQAVADIKESNPALTLEGLLSSLFNSDEVGPVKLDRQFNLITEAWNNTTEDKYSKADLSKLYNRMYLKQDQIDKLANLFNGGTQTERSKPVAPPVQNQLTPGTDSTKIDEEVIYDPVIEDLSNEELSPHTERKFATVGLKLGGVLGLEYEETPDGKVDTTNVVNESAKPFMDWRNFREGSEISFVFDIDYLLGNNLLPLWENMEGLNLDGKDKPTRRLEPVAIRLVRLFKNSELNSWEKIRQALEDYRDNPSSDNPLLKNEEFLKIVPIATKNTVGYTDAQGNQPKQLPGGLNDYYWFNNSNVALKVEKNSGTPFLEEREQRIEANRQLNLMARKAIATNGSFDTVINEKRDAANNTVKLETEEEINLGYTESFRSLLAQFGNSLEDFQKNAGLSYLSKTNSFIGSKDNSGREVPVKVNGVDVLPSQILNLEAYLSVAKKSGYTTGRPVLIVKDGVDATGNPVYVAHDLISNHNAMQDDFVKTHNIANRLYYKILSETSTDLTKEVKDKFKKEFKKQLGYDFTQSSKDRIERNYPSKSTNAEGMYQKFDADAMTKGSKNLIPDFSKYDSVDAFIKSVTSGEPIATIDKREKMVGNFHTNLVFTPIVKNGETIYTSHSQPIMDFDIPNREELKQKELEAEKQNLADYKKMLELRKKALEQEEETNDSKPEGEVKNEVEKVIQEEVKKVEAETKRVEQKADVIEQIEKSDNTSLIEQAINRDAAMEDALKGLVTNSNNAMGIYTENFVNLHFESLLAKLEASDIIKKDC